MRTNIENIEQLRAEIRVLKLQKAEQELYFVQKKESIKNFITSPITFLKKVGSFFGISGEADKDSPTREPKNADWATTLARVVVPFLLNKTLLRGNGLIIKSLLTLVSQRAINPENFNQNKVSGWIDKLTGWVNSKIAKPAKKKIDYGIPPDSETY